MTGGGVRLLSVLEHGARAARRLGLGRLVDRLGPAVGHAAARAEVEVDGFRFAGTHAAHLFYLREVAEEGRERLFTELIRELAPRGGTAVEAGAHIGVVTVHLADSVGDGGRVLAFEPNPEIHDVLRANLRRNGLEARVTVLPQALGSRPGRTQLFVSGGGETSSLHDQGTAHDRVEVDVVRLDDVLEEPPGLVKLDIEGGEVDAIEGMSRVSPPVVFLECNPSLLAAAGRSAEDLRALLAGHGFAIWTIDEPGGRLRAFDGSVAGEYVNLVAGRGAAAARLEPRAASGRSAL